MAGPVGPLMYGIFAAAALGARTGAALRHVLIKLGTKAADTATKQGKLVKKIDMRKYASKEGKELLQQRWNLPPMPDKVAKAIQVAGFATIAGKSAERVYDTEKKKRSQIAAKKRTGKKRSQIAAKKRTGHVDYRTGGMFYKSGSKK